VTLRAGKPLQATAEQQPRQWSRQQRLEKDKSFSDAMGSRRAMAVMNARAGQKSASSGKIYATMPEMPDRSGSKTLATEEPPAMPSVPLVLDHKPPLIVEPPPAAAAETNVPPPPPNKHPTLHLFLPWQLLTPTTLVFQSQIGNTLWASLEAWRHCEPKLRNDGISMRVWVWADRLTHSPDIVRLIRGLSISMLQRRHCKSVQVHDHPIIIIIPRRLT